jgi:hypothetical protein
MPRRPRRWEDHATYAAAWRLVQAVPVQQCCVCQARFVPSVHTWLRHKHRPQARWVCGKRCAGVLGAKGLWGTSEQGGTGVSS